jgi:hypothetical protein
VTDFETTVGPSRGGGDVSIWGSPESLLAVPELFPNLKVSTAPQSPLLLVKSGIVSISAGKINTNFTEPWVGAKHTAQEASLNSEPESLEDSRQYDLEPDPPELTLDGAYHGLPIVSQRTFQGGEFTPDTTMVEGYYDSAMMPDADYTLGEFAAPPEVYGRHTPDDTTGEIPVRCRLTVYSLTLDELGQDGTLTNSPQDIESATNVARYREKDKTSVRELINNALEDLNLGSLTQPPFLDLRSRVNNVHLLSVYPNRIPFDASILDAAFNEINDTSGDQKCTPQAIHVINDSFLGLYIDEKGIPYFFTQNLKLMQFFEEFGGATPDQELVKGQAATKLWLENAMWKLQHALTLCFRGRE